MPIVSLILTLVLVGVLLWALNTFIPMDAKIKQIINVVAIVCVVLWLLNVFGVFPASFGNVPRLK